MPVRPRLPGPDALAWPALCLLLGLASSVVWYLDGSAALAWHADNWQRHPWSLWSASLAHLSGAHLLANLAALLVLGVLGCSLRAGTGTAVALLLAWPISTLALLLWPQVGGYSGMSGLLNAMAAVLWAHAALAVAARSVSWLIFAALAVKLLAEGAWSAPIAFDPNWGFNVVYAAHLGGALAGAGCGLLVGMVMRQHTRPPA